MRTLPNFSWIILVFSLMFLLAACGGAPSPAAQPTATAAAATSQKTDPVQTQVVKTNLPKSEANPMLQPKRTLNIAHRGARSLAPENTLAAARKGFEIGADMWELDVAMTSDGVLVVLHDDTLERTSNVADVFPDRRKTLVYDFTLADLRKLDFGSWYVKTDPFKQIAAGNVSKDDQEKFKGEPIPTLEDALKFTKDSKWKVNVEIKDASKSKADATIVEKTVKMIEDLGLVNQVIISSFNHSYIQKVKKLNPNIVTAALVESGDGDPAGLLKRLGADAYNPPVKSVAPSSIKPMRNAGYDVYVWTVNDEATMKALVDGGASGVITDYPQLLKTVLK